MAGKGRPKGQQSKSCLIKDDNIILRLGGRRTPVYMRYIPCMPPSIDAWIRQGKVPIYDQFESTLSTTDQVYTYISPLGATNVNYQAFKIVSLTNPSVSTEVYTIFINMAHKVFIRHTYIYKCDSCEEEWKINEAASLEHLSCPHCGKNDVIEYVVEDQRVKYRNRHV